MHSIVEIHWYMCCGALPSWVRTKPGAEATIAFRVSFFDWVTGGDDCMYESKLWSHDRIHTQALDEEWTRD